MEVNLNVFNILIISGVVYGIIFCGILLYQKRKYKKNLIFLALLVLFLSLSNLQYWLFDTNLVSNYKFIQYVYIPWQWLILPMFYLFVKGFINQKKTVATVNIALFIPFVVVQTVHIVQVIYHFTIDPSFTIPSHFSTGIYVYFEIGSILFNLLLIAITLRTILSFEKSINLDIASIKPKTLWLKKLIYTGFVVCFFWAIGIVLIMIFNVNKSYVFYPLWIVISILIYWMGHLGLQKSKELHEQILLRQKRIRNTKDKKQPTISHSVNSKHTDLVKEFEHIFQEELIHLDSNLSLDTVATQLNVSKSHLSKILKEYKKCSFTEYVTLLRLEEAKKFLKNDEYATYTIAAIGLECGFNSKSAFYNAFKKYLNCTPSDFRKE